MKHLKSANHCNIAFLQQFICSNIQRSIFLFAVSIAVTFGFIFSGIELISLQTKLKLIPFTFYGTIFNGLSTVLKNEKYIGYYTDKNILEAKYGAQFQQTQLALAPLILDLNSTSRRFTIFDCLNIRTCITKISEIKAQPLKTTNQGIILTIKE